MNIPSKIWKGDSQAWNDGSVLLRRAGMADVTIASNASWVLTYYIAGPTAAISTVGTADGVGGWNVTLSTAQTGAFSAPGTYAWQAVATKGSEAITLGSGNFETADRLVGASAGFVAKSQTELDLEACQGAIRSRLAGGGIAEYIIGTRRLRYETLVDLRKLEVDLTLKFNREKRAEAKANGQGDPRLLHVRF